MEKKNLYFQYLGLGVELLTPSNRSTTKQQRQTSQRAQDFDQDLRQGQIYFRTDKKITNGFPSNLPNLSSLSNTRVQSAYRRELDQFLFVK